MSENWTLKISSLDRKCLQNSFFILKKKPMKKQPTNYTFMGLYLKYQIPMSSLILRPPTVSLNYNGLIKWVYLIVCFQWQLKCF